MRPVVVFDLDGTLADTRHRAHLIAKGGDADPDWHAYSLACPNDTPIAGAVELARLLDNLGCSIVLVSGRSDAAYDETVGWLDVHGVPYDALHMRAAGDHRPNEVIKAELAVALSLEAAIALWVDDYPTAVDALTAASIPALLVARDGVQ